MTSTSHHHPIVALFFSLNGRKIDDPRTKREIKRRPFILAQKDRRSHRETHPLHSKRMRFVAPFPRARVPLVQRERAMIKFYREKIISLTLPFAARARVQNNNNKRKNAGESKQQRAFCCVPCLQKRLCSRALPLSKKRLPSCETMLCKK